MVLLIATLSIELAVFSFNTVNRDRRTLSSDYIKSKSGYFDHTNDAVAYLKAMDKDFYRIDKDYQSQSYADALFQGWKGTKAYSGWIKVPYLHFLRTMDLKSTDE
jgi:hypothetical protein